VDILKENWLNVQNICGSKLFDKHTCETAADYFNISSNEFCLMKNILAQITFTAHTLDYTHMPEHLSKMLAFLNDGHYLYEQNAPAILSTGMIWASQGNSVFLKDIEFRLSSVVESGIYLYE